MNLHLFELHNQYTNYSFDSGMFAYFAFVVI